MMQAISLFSLPCVCCTSMIALTNSCAIARAGVKLTQSHSAKKKNLHNLISGQNSHPTMTIIMTNPSSGIWIHKLWRRKCHVVGLHFCRKMKLFIHNKRTAERQGQKSTVGFKDIVRLLVVRFLVNCVQAASNKFYPHPHPLIHFEKVYAMKIITYSCHNFNQTECN